MRLLLTLFLITTCCCSNAQGYMRAAMGADGSSGTCEFYHFERFPERLPATTDFRGRFGAGWILEAEAGYRFSSHLEACINYTCHGSVFSGAFDYYEPDSLTITVRRIAVLNARNRAGFSVCYFFGQKRIQPFLTGGVQFLIHPNWRMAYDIDTTPQINGIQRRGEYVESYTGGLSAGYSIGGGIAFKRNSRLSGMIRMKYTFQSWTPKRMDHSFVYNSYKREDDVSVSNPGIRVPMNAFGIVVGATFSFGEFGEVKAEPTDGGVH